MKFFNNVLSDQTLQIVFDEIRVLVEEQVWNTSRTWGSKITTSGLNTCLVTAVSNEQIKNSIINDLGDSLPNCDVLRMNYYLWGQGSSIDLHTDGREKRAFGGTIYLTTEWNINDGGMFVWKEHEDDWRVYVPKFNSMVLNTTFKEHLVTPISLRAPDYRFTIQLWGDYL